MAGRNETPAQTSRTLGEGHGWRAAEVVCTAGPEHKPFEEMHAEYSIGAVLSGSFTYRSQRGRAFLALGSLLLGNAGACFECGHDHGTGDRCVAIYLTQDLFAEIASQTAGVTSLDFPRHRLPPAMDRLATLTRLDARTGAMKFEETVMAIAAHAIRSSRLLPVERSVRATAHELKGVCDVVRFIERSYAEDMSLESLAARSRLSRFRLLRVFRAVVGMTPYQYLLHTRLRAAAHLLRERRTSVLDIALASGFGDLSEFTRRFGAVFGTSPARFAAR